MLQDPAAPAKAADTANHAGQSETLRTVSTWTEQVVTYAVEYGPKVLAVLVVLLVAWVASRWVRRLVLAGLEKAHFDITLSRFFANMSRWMILALAVLACLETFGIKSTSVAAVVGAVGLAVALGFQGTLGNLASGVLLLVFRPFKVSDTVIVAGQSGVVDTIDLFTTNLDTGDYRRIIIPNSAIFNAIIENSSHHDRRRADLTIVASTLSDLAQTRLALERAAGHAAETEGALRSPPPAVTLADFTAAGLVWQVQVWCSTDRLGAVRTALITAVKSAIDSGEIVLGRGWTPEVAPAPPARPS